MRHSVYVIAVVLNLFGVILAIDYCGKGLCPSGKKHVSCGCSIDKFGPECSKDAEIVQLTPTWKEMILDLHNKARNTVALGELNGYSKAVRMPQLKWDDELAFFAQCNANTCKFSHDQCRNTMEYKAAGQNIAYMGKYKSYVNVGEAFERIIMKMWFEEHKIANMTDIQSYKCSKSQTPRVVGHFLQLIGDKTTKVGCALTRYTDRINTDLKNLYMVCDYSFTNVCGAATYSHGEKACSKCTTGCSQKYPGLCGENEVVNSYANGTIYG